MQQTKTIRTSLIMIVVLLFVLILKGALTSGYVGSIPKGSAMSAYVEAAIVTPGAASLPVEDSDFKIVKTAYEDNNQWAIVTVSKSGNQATLVLEKINGVYSVVMGPGTTFPISSTYAMPPDVVSYLSSYGMLLNGVE